MTTIKVTDLVMPYFVIEGKGKRQSIKSMPGVSRFSVDQLLKEIAQAKVLGIKKILLFGVPSPAHKDARGSCSCAPDSVVLQAVSAIKEKMKDMVVMTDVCLCAYTAHGHCGVLDVDGRTIDSKPTLEALGRMALVHAQAGADWVAPSAMAKKQVHVIRKTLDKGGYPKTKILGYSAKFASQFYGPFREAADSSPKFGDRRAYQLDPANAKAALKEIHEDIKEGADMVMVKPALSYLDIIKEARERFNVPVAAYNVSGEYAFVKFGARHGLWQEEKVVHEILTSIKRAGADVIITYHAKDVAQWEKERGQKNNPKS